MSFRIQAPRIIRPFAFKPWSHISRRGLAISAGEVSKTATTEPETLPNRILTAALPMVPEYGFSSAALLAGVASTPELSHLSIGHWTLTGLFPSSTSTLSPTNQREPIGPSKALAQKWIAYGNEHMKSMIRKEKLTLQNDGPKRAFELRLLYNRTIPSELLLQALALTATPTEPFFGIQLPVEPPHLLPYGSHALEVATAALAGLQDYSKSREWMLRRIRLAVVWSAIELIAIGDHQPFPAVLNQLENLLAASETAAARIGDTVEFLAYVSRSQRAIVRSLAFL